MPERVGEFIQMIRDRTDQNRIAMQRISPVRAALSPAIAILRQELDSMVRVIFLLQQVKEERVRLVNDTLDGKKWALPFLGVVTEENVSDRVGEVVDLRDGQSNGQGGEVDVQAQAGPERLGVF